MNWNVQFKVFGKTAQDLGKEIEYCLAQGIGKVIDSQPEYEPWLRAWPKSEQDRMSISSYVEEVIKKIFPNKGKEKITQLGRFIKFLEEGGSIKQITVKHYMYEAYIRQKKVFEDTEVKFMEEHKSIRHMQMSVEGQLIWSTRFQGDFEDLGGVIVFKKQRHLYIQGSTNTGKTTFVRKFEQLGFNVAHLDDRHTLNKDEADIIIFDDWKSIPFSMLSKLTQGGPQFQESTYKHRITVKESAQIIIVSNVPPTSLIECQNREEMAAFYSRFICFYIQDGYILDLCDYA